MYKTPSGERITWKEFVARWKSGVEGVTQLQQIKVQINSTYIILFGVIAGFIISLFNIKSLWWLSVILLGALGNTWIQLLGLKQKKLMLDKFDITFKELEGGDNDEQESTA